MPEDSYDVPDDFPTLYERHFGRKYVGWYTESAEGSLMPYEGVTR